MKSPDGCLNAFSEDFELVDDEAVLKDFETENSVEAATIYFKIDLEALLHCWGPGHQNTIRFGGRPLHESSSFVDIAYNIVMMLKKLEGIE